MLRVRNAGDHASSDVDSSEYSSKDDDDDDDGRRQNWEVFAGTGRRCLPGDADACGDGRPAAAARLDYPKSVAAAADGTVYVSDGRSVRVVSPDGIIDTLIGSSSSGAASAPPSPLACRSVFEDARQVRPQWPTKLAIDPLDGALHLVDDTLVLRLTSDMQAEVVAGKSPLCNDDDGEDGETSKLGHVTAMAFSPDGELYLAERRPRPLGARISVVDREGSVRTLAGAGDERGHGCLCLSNVLNCTSSSSSSSSSSCPQRGKTRLLAHEAGLGSAVSGLAVTPDGAVHVSDDAALRVLTFRAELPAPDPDTGDVSVADPEARELYTFNRHGQHVHTHSLDRGSSASSPSSSPPLYTFSYSKDAVSGRLTEVADALGNKLSLQRDYSGRVQAVEDSGGQKVDLALSRLGRLESFGDGIRFHYDDGGLLTGVSQVGGGGGGGSGGRFKTFSYDAHGRLASVVTDSGESTHFESGFVGVRECPPGIGRDSEPPRLCARVTRNGGGSEVVRLARVRSGGAGTSVEVLAPMANQMSGEGERRAFLFVVVVVVARKCVASAAVTSFKSPFPNPL